MEFSVSGLLQEPTGARRRYEIDEEIAGIDRNEVKVLAPIVGSITFTHSVQGILVTGELQTQIEAICTRCLSPYALDVVIELEEEFVPSVDIHTGASLPIPSGADPALLINAHHILDLTEVIRQHLVLFQTTCGPCRPDCAGLCPQCGHNLNEGPCDCSTTEIVSPFAVLQELL